MKPEFSLCRDTALRVPESGDVTQAKLPSLPGRFLNPPWPDMPEKMLVVIDGWSDTPKALTGEWVAASLGGLLVDSEKIFRSLVTAGICAGVDVKNHVQVASWCEQAAVDVGFAKDGRVTGAQVAVNGRWFKNSELRETGAVASRTACDVFWGKIRQILRRCDFDDRVVIIGNDVGFEFPRTPYKFFLDNTGGNRNFTELAGLAYPWLGDRSNFSNDGATYFDQRTKTLVIDTNSANAGDVVCIVLVESVARACEMGLCFGPRERALEHAYISADATRRRMKAVLSESPK